MTDERLSIGEIYDAILNNDEMWKEVHFVRVKKETTITAVDAHGTKYTYSEEIQ